MKHSMRNWHTWGSLALGLPLLLVGLTTFFIAHEKSLGTKEILLPLGAKAGPKSGAGPEIRASARIGAEQWIGGPQGVYRVEADAAVPVEGAPRDEIRGMVAAGDAVLLAGKKALWRLQGGVATPVQQADCWQVTADGAGYVAACKELGLLVSADGRSWQPRTLSFPAQTLAATAGTPLSKIIMDAHTGKLFLGKEYEWIWIDLLGLACVGLGLTGLVMWMRSRRQRAAAAG